MMVVPPGLGPGQYQQDSGGSPLAGSSLVPTRWWWFPTGWVQPGTNKTVVVPSWLGPARYPEICRLYKETVLKHASSMTPTNAATRRWWFPPGWVQPGTRASQPGHQWTPKATSRPASQDTSQLARTTSQPAGQPDMVSHRSLADLGFPQVPCRQLFGKLTKRYLS